MDEMIFQIPGEIVKDKSLLNGARQFVIETQEDIRPEMMQRLLKLEHKTGWFTFSVDIIDAEAIVNLPKIDASLYPKKKSPSERMRAVIYLLWEKAGRPGDFQTYYDKTMEAIIEQLKERLD